MEKTPLLENKVKTTVPKKTRFAALILVNIVLCLWTIAREFHSPVVTQYFYKRVQEEVYPNGTQPEQKNFTCFKNISSEDFKLEEKAQQITNTMQMHFSISKCALELVVNIVLGSYSDYVGRKMLFLVPTVGYLIKNTMLTAIIYWRLDLNFYYVGEILEGASGGSSLFSLACYACVTDHTPAKGSRTLAMVMIDVTSALAKAAVSTITGIFIKEYGFFYPSLASAVLMVVVLVAVKCILPDSVNTKGGSLKNLVGGVKNVFAAFVLEGNKRKKTLFWLALVTYFLSTLSSYVGNIGTLWMLNYPLCWGPDFIGYYGTASTLLTQILALPLIRMFQFCLSDEIVAIWSSLVTVATNAFHAFAVTNWLMYGVAIVGSLTLALTPIIRAIMSRLTPPDRQGSLMASLTAVGIVCQLLGEPMFSYIYKSTIFMFRGTTYLVVAGGNGLATITFTVFAIIVRGHYRAEETLNSTTHIPEGVVNGEPDMNDVQDQTQAIN